MRHTFYTRPAKVDKFLSHLFPTENDKLYFEMCFATLNNTYDYFSVVTKVLELVIPMQSYLVKLNSLFDVTMIDDNRVPIEIHEKTFYSLDPIVIDMRKTTKTTDQRLDFIKKLHKPQYKIHREYKLREANLNTYIFVVSHAFLKETPAIKRYTLRAYRDKDYEFTETDKNEYREHLSRMNEYMQRLYEFDFGYNTYLLDDLLDVFVKVFEVKEEPIKEEPIIKQEEKREEKQGIRRERIRKAVKKKTKRVVHKVSNDDDLD